MSDQYLSCNFRTCMRRLKEQAYVTTCSHIFCVDHGQKALQNKSPPECPVCGTRFNKQYDFVLINLNPNDEYKSMILTGLHPDVALEIASRSISYYIYQLSFDNNNKDNIIRQIKKQNVEIKEYGQKLSAAFKNNLSQANAKLKAMEKEMEEKARETECIKHQLLEANRCIKKLQSQLDWYKRENTSLKMQTEASDTNMNNNNNPDLFFDYSSSIRTPTFNFRNIVQKHLGTTYFN